MDLIISNLCIPVEEDGPEAYLHAAGREACTAEGAVIRKILSKAIDLGDQEQFFYRIALVLSVPDGYANTRNFPIYREPVQPERSPVKSPDRPLVVGFGPAGMFAALELIDRGLQPVIFERGKKIEERSGDVSRFITERQLNPESNIQFGEGGAGSYSDGKLFSRRNLNTSYVSRVLDTLIRFGAPAEIAYISKPHLGTDVLCRIVRNIRKHVLDRGGEIHYGARMTDLLIREGVAEGIIINGEREYLSSAIFLALGHSARDTVEMLQRRGVALEQRAIAVGVRIEHPVETINLLRYGNKYKDFKGLGAASYSLNYTDRTRKRGVYTFCMCPGGEIVNASSEQGMLVLNGMSYSQRSQPFSNGALVVSCHPGDYGSDNPLAGFAFQRDIERKAFQAGGGRWHVPAQNLLDFLEGKSTVDLPENSYKMGAVPAELKDLFPAFVVEQLMAAFQRWKVEVPLFVSGQAIVFGAETRTSSPVRISRNERFESVNTRNLYPIGEGSGYTGGITSSAADAVRAVEVCLQG
ncbi:MAG: dehydrogenase [Proteobacteria bacterium]|nr:dehydrogenase [Pseudomonadota bacterium]MBU1736810.1 dehydrogenase [Pseudomonadota bacterium]